MLHGDDSALKTDAACDHPIARNLALAHQLGVQGTPTLIWADGTDRGLRGTRGAGASRRSLHQRRRKPPRETAMKTLVLRIGHPLPAAPLGRLHEHVRTGRRLEIRLQGPEGSPATRCRAPTPTPSTTTCPANGRAPPPPAQEAPKRIRPNRPARPHRPSQPPAMPMAGHAQPLALPGPRLLRLWIKPWEDADGDLYDQGYVYVPGGQRPMADRPRAAPDPRRLCATQAAAQSPQRKPPPPSRTPANPPAAPMFAAAAPVRRAQCPPCAVRPP